MLKQLSKITSSKGYILVIIAAVLNALAHVLAKPMLEAEQFIEINPVFLAFFIYAISGLFFTPLARKTTSIRLFHRKDIFFLIVIGITEVAALITFFFGLKDSTAVNAAIFSNSEIVFSLMIAMIFFRERLRKNELGPFSMIIFGIIALPLAQEIYHTGFVFSSIMQGDMMIFLAGLFYAIDITLCKYVGDRYDPKRVTQIVSFVGAGFALSLIIIFGIPMDMQLEQIPGMLTVSVVGIGLSTLFFLLALKAIGAMRTVLLYSTTSLFGIIFAGIILSENVTMIDFASIFIVLAGMYFLRNKLAEEHEDNTKSEIPSENLKSSTLPVKKTIQTKSHNKIIQVKSIIKNYFKIRIILNLMDGG